METVSTKILLLGVLPGLTVEEVAHIKTLISEDFPEHTVRVVPGLYQAFEFTVNRTVEQATPNAAYL